jgi:hypothetical protein
MCRGPNCTTDGYKFQHHICANGRTDEDMKLLVNTHYQKPGLCRVHDVWHSANNHFAECRKNKNTRQKKALENISINLCHQQCSG